MNKAPLYKIGSLAYAPGSVQGLFSSLITTCLPASPLKNWSIMLVSVMFQTFRLFFFNLFQFTSLWFGIQSWISCTLLLLYRNCKSKQNFQIHQKNKTISLYLTVSSNCTEILYCVSKLKFSYTIFIFYRFNSHLGSPILIC